MLRLLALLTTLALLLGGCSTATQPKPAGSAPATVTTPSAPAKVELPPAQIRGSQETSALLDNFTAFVASVDGEKVSAGRAGWDKPIKLPAGNHRLGVEFNRGAFVARTELLLKAKPETLYELRFTTDAQVYGGHSYCEFWIVEVASDEKVTVSKRVTLDKIPAGN